MGEHPLLSANYKRQATVFARMKAEKGNSYQRHSATPLLFHEVESQKQVYRMRIG